MLCLGEDATRIQQYRNQEVLQYFLKHPFISCSSAVQFTQFHCKSRAQFSSLVGWRIFRSSQRSSKSSEIIENIFIRMLIKGHTLNFTKYVAFQCTVFSKHCWLRTSLFYNSKTIFKLAIYLTFVSKKHRVWSDRVSSGLQMKQIFTVSPYGISILVSIERLFRSNVHSNVKFSRSYILTITLSLDIRLMSPLILLDFIALL